ncbi:hypothetical protein H9Q10_06365 [Eikenella sp. S3360]|uniref:MAPEG family protein n=1 Tax=Eikenella glucosivorans TaxID=2766967 RepID=A0ABS0NAI1_9NEIS|nr:hypothetical protein [Eikenella glucosivorans]MBH5329292.1 hypothetical protein [Eikenella glucosivorans]
MSWFFVYFGSIVLLLIIELGLRLHVDKYAAPLLAWYRHTAPPGSEVKEDYFLPNSMMWRGMDFSTRPVERLVWRHAEVAENPYIRPAAYAALRPYVLILYGVILLQRGMFFAVPLLLWLWELGYLKN